MEKRINKERIKKKKELHGLVQLTPRRFRHKMSYNYQ